MNLKNLVLSGLMAFYLTVVPVSNSVVFADNTSSQDSSVKTELSSQASLEDKLDNEPRMSYKELDRFIVEYYFDDNFDAIRHPDFPKEAVGSVLRMAKDYNMSYKELGQFIVEYYFDDRFDAIRNPSFPKDAVGSVLRMAKDYNLSYKELDRFIVEYYFDDRFDAIRHPDFPKDAVGSVLQLVYPLKKSPEYKILNSSDKQF